MRGFGLGSVLFIAALAFLFSGALWAQDGSKENYTMGIRAIADQDYVKAVEHFKKSLETEGETPETLNNLGFALHNISRQYVNDAYRYYQMALKSSPKNEEALNYIGQLYISQLNLAKAAETLNKLKAIESTEAETLENELNKVVSQVKKMEMLQKKK